LRVPEMESEAMSAKPIDLMKIYPFAWAIGAR
jgi:hypothetical protein